jgi:hypothetical protein
VGKLGHTTEIIRLCDQSTVEQSGAVLVGFVRALSRLKDLHLEHFDIHILLFLVTDEYTGPLPAGKNFLPSEACR